MFCATFAQPLEPSWLGVGVSDSWDSLRGRLAKCQWDLQIITSFIQ
jgi:hypothetical protein